MPTVTQPSRSMAPGWAKLADLCRTVSNIENHRHLRSANLGQP